MTIVPDFGDPEPCHFCGEDSTGVAWSAGGYWAPLCTACLEPDQPYRGAS